MDNPSHRSTMSYSPLPETIANRQRLANSRMSALVIALVAIHVFIPATANLALDVVPTVPIPVEVQELDTQSFAASADVVVATVSRDKYEVVAPRQTIQYASGSSLAGNSIIWPFSVNSISDPYGPRPAPCTGCGTFHGGSDFAHNAGQPIPAVADGIVRTVDFRSDYGQRIIIDHIIDGRMVSTLYAHMVTSSPTVRPGQVVRAGSTIGYVGTTGLSTGEHLHLEVLLDGSTRTNPVAWLRANVR